MADIILYKGLTDRSRLLIQMQIFRAYNAFGLVTKDITSVNNIVFNCQSVLKEERTFLFVRILKLTDQCSNALQIFCTI